MSIKVILWDVDGTLLNFKLAEGIAIRKLFNKYGFGECTDEMLSKYSKINESYWKKLEANQITKKEVLLNRFVDFFSMYHLDTSKAADFNADYQECLGDTACFNENGLEVVKTLKNKVKQYAVTNGSKIAQTKKLRLSNLDVLLDDVFISEDIGIEKPNTGYFDKVFEKIGHYEKDEMIIIGDSLTSDIQGGNNIGIKTCWFNLYHKQNRSTLRIDYEIDNLAEVLKILELNK